MGNNAFEIPVDDAIQEFCEHLASHPRTILSAKFGDGKTYFLNKILNDTQANERFTFIKIYPINYQVEANTDVFELVKRDILFQLIKNKLIPQDYEIPDSIALPFFLQTKACDIVESILSTASKLNASSIEVKLLLSMLKGSKLLSSLKKHYNEFKKEDTNEQIIGEFIERTERYGIYECDPVTELIRECIQNHRKSTQKRVVLIFEDMDRMDPSHIFRILNILSTQIDYCYRDGVPPVDQVIAGNKFGVDNIVLVLDYNNLGNIFHHFYGDDTNFDGYISKFINRGYFSYSLAEQRTKYIYQGISNATQLPEQIIQLFLHQKLIIPERDVLASKTIRDVVSSFEDIDSQINIKTMALNLEGVTYRIHPGILRMIVVVRRLGFTDDEIVRIIVGNLTPRNDLLIPYVVPFFILKEKDNPLLGEIGVLLSQTISIVLNPRQLTADGLLRRDVITRDGLTNYDLQKEPCVRWLLSLVSK